VHSTVEHRPVQRHEARALEERFLSALSANTGRLIRIPPRPGVEPIATAACRRDVWPFDRTDEVKRVMADHGLYDRDVLEEMPTDRALVIEYSRRRLLRRRKVVGLMGLVVNPLDALAADGRSDRPATLAQATERLEALLPRDGTFHYVGAFSPTGWEGAALDDIPRGDDYELYLVEKGDGTEWLVHGRGVMRHTFNPEREAERLDRCRAFIREHRGETMLGGLSAAQIAAGVRVEAATAEHALTAAARGDDHLILREIDGAVRLIHTDQAAADPPASVGEADAPDQTQRSEAMGLWERLLQWLGLRKKVPSPDEMVRELEQRRARLQVQRDDLDGRIEDLEKTQREFGEQLRAEESPTRRVGLAQKIANVRRRVKQLHRQMSRYDKAISIHTTHISNLTAATELRQFKLPTEADMKQVAVEVDAADEELTELSDLALSLDEGAMADAVSPEVEAILAEFGVAEPKIVAPAEPRKAPAAPRETTARPAAEKSAPEPPPREAAPPAAD